MIISISRFKMVKTKAIMIAITIYITSGILIFFLSLSASPNILKNLFLNKHMGTC